MILVITLLRRDFAFVMAMIFNSLLVLLWTRRKSAHCGAADGKKPSGVEYRKYHDCDYELLMTSQAEISPSLGWMQPRGSSSIHFCSGLQQQLTMAFFARVQYNFESFCTQQHFSIFLFVSVQRIVGFADFEARV